MRALALLLPLAACGAPQSEARPSYTIDPERLALCFTDAYDDPKVDEAMSRCEQQYFGSEWRKEPHDGGNLEPRLVQAGIKARMHRIRACYRAGVKRDTSLAGEVRVKFVINDAGKSTGASDDGSKLKDKQVVACVVQEFGALRFPKPEGGPVPVTYPIVFGAADLVH
jgi:hypothetical protein